MDADLFVSLHYNSSNGDRQGVRGVEVYCLTPAEAHSTNTRGEDSSTHALPGNAFNAHNLLLAYRIQAALVRSLDCEDRGVGRARFAVLRNPGMPAVLVEAGFMSDPREAAEILDESRRETTAQAIVDGVLAYKRFVERQ
jgi:N-acetylmuramoyl-L-alanine amidase